MVMAGGPDGRTQPDRAHQGSGERLMRPRLRSHRLELQFVLHSAADRESCCVAAHAVRTTALVAVQLRVCPRGHASTLTESIATPATGPCGRAGYSTGGRGPLIRRSCLRSSDGAVPAPSPA